MDKEGFYVIEPSFYNELDWDMDQIMKCLEYMRLHINNDLFHHTSSKFYLISYGDFLGGSFPSIGARSDSVEEAKEFSNFNEVYEKVKNWIDAIGMEELKKRSKHLEVISWEELKVTGNFPID